MKNLKKAVSVILAFLMLFTAFPMQNFVYAESNPSGKSIVFTFTDEDGDPVDLTGYNTSDIFWDSLGENYTISGNTITSVVLENMPSSFDYAYEIRGIKGYQNNGSISYSGTITLDDDGCAKIPISLTKLKNVSLKTTPCNMTYGDKVDLSNCFSLSDEWDGSLSDVKVDIDSCSLLTKDKTSGDFCATATSAGNSTVHVSVPETDTYAAAEADISISVSKKSVTITNDDIADGSYIATKAYDGSFTVPVTGTITIDGEEVAYSGIATTKSAICGEHDGVLSELKLDDHTDIYNATFAENLDEVKTSIEKCPVDVSVGNIELSYGSSDWEYIKNGDYDSFLTEEKIAGLISTSTSIPDDIKAEAIASMLNAISVTVDADKLKKADYGVGTYDDAIEITFDDTKSGNFSFSTSSSPSISIITETTTDDDALWNRIEIDEKSAVGAYVNGKTTYLAKDGYVTYKIKDSESGKYDSVAIRISDSYSNKVTGGDSDGYLSGTFYLYNSKNPDTRTDADPKKSGAQDNNIPANVLCVDNESPVVYFNDEEMTNLTDETISDISFSEIISDKLPSIKGSCEDKISGIKSAAYTVIKADNLDKSLVEIAKDTEMTAWKSGDTFDLSDIKNDGYYVLITKVTDNTDNVSYQAYGILKDTSSPSLTVSGIDNNGIYNKDVNYTLDISDMADAVSGLSKISVEVTADGKAATSTRAYTNSYVVTQEEIDTLIGSTSTNPADKEVLGKTLTINGCIAKELNSSNINIKISAVDRVGNSIEKSYAISIDTDAPTINVSYDNNSVKNETFFKNTRTATVKISERSYNEDSVVFTIGVDGEKKDYSLAELKDGQALSVKFIGESKESGVCTYQLLFGNADEDHTYTFDVSAKDMAGNMSEPVRFADGTKAGASFTVDMVPIKAAMTFTDEDGNTLSVSDVVTYSNKKVDASIYLEENHYDASEATATINQIDANGNVVSAYDVSAFLNVLKDSALESDALDGSYSFPTFERDANYTISLSVSDKAGNVTKINNLKLTVDRTSPTGSITVKTDETDGTYTSVSKTAKFWHISNDKATIDATYADATSGIAKVEYYLYTPAEDASGTFDIPDITTLSDDVWKTWTGRVSLDMEGQSIACLKITDMAGNICYINANDGTIIDKTAASTPKITLETGDENTIYNNDVPFTISVTDPTSGGTYAGLKSVTYEVLKDGSVTQSNTYSFSDRTQRVKSAGYSETVLAEKNNSDNVKIRVTAKDYAGNTSTAEKSLKIDITAPTVDVSYDNNSVKNETFFKDVRTATVKITERSYDENAVVFSIGVDGAAKDYSLADLKAGSVPSVKFVDAAQKGEVYTYSLIFGNANEDHTYSFDVSLKDLAGNMSEPVNFADGTKAGASFTVDMVPIKAEMTFKDESGNTLSISDVVTYCNKKVNASIYLKENHYDAAGATATINQTDVNGNTVKSYDVSAFLDVLKDTALEGKKLDGSYLFPVFEKDANYTISLSVSDKAGNVTEINNQKLTVDRTAPTGSISIKTDETDGTYTGINKTAKPWHISNSKADVSAIYADATSGVAKVEYYLYTPAEDASGTFALPDITTISDKEWQKWSGQLSLNTEGQSIVCLKITDMAGNICYINANDETIIDKTSPLSPQITLDVGDTNTVYNSDVPFTISVTDPTSGGTYAGLKSVTYEVLKDGVVTQSNTYTLSDRTQRVKSASYSETVIAEKNNSNHVTIRVTAVDYAGNSSTAEKSLKIDITAPRIEISYDSTTDNGYYNNTRTATVSVYERNFDPSAFKLDIQNVLGNNAEVGSWSLAQDMGESDDALSTLKVIFDKDDDYTVTASVTDMAGNSTSLGRTDKFTIDKTLPVVSIDFDNNSPSNGKYYNAARTATITVKERNFDASRFAIDVASSLEGQAITSPSISGWSGSGETHTASITFNADGNYSFNCTAGDMAGNVSDKVSVGEFTLDFVKPVISIEGITDQSAYNGELNPIITYTDLNLGDATHATITLKGARHEEQTITGSVEEVVNGWRVLLSDIEKSRDTDDVYTLTVTATDLAGNVETQTVTFSVNRFGSNFTFDTATETILDNFYLQEAEDLVVYETNVNDITHRSITLGANGVTNTLEEGIDYTVKENVTSGWKVYTYTISKDNFEEEGIYEMVITSTDAAGNTQDNKLKEMPITLAIDKTAPAVVISGVKNGESYNATSKDVTFTVSDNLAIGTLDVYLNDELAESFTAEELDEADGAVTITVDEANGYQEVFAVASDAAGNETASDTCRFLISSNAFTRFFYNRPLFIGTIVAVIAAIAGLLFLLWKKNANDKKDKKAGKAPTEELDTKPKGDEETEEITK